MPSNKDDLFGGMFDFNGDGKTDIGEEWIAFNIFQECMKDENEQSDSPMPIHTNRKRPVREINHVTVIPEKPTDEEYSKLRKSIKGDYFITIIAAIVICFPAGAFLVAAIKTYDANNSASGFLVALFVGILLAVVCGVIIAIKNDFKYHNDRLRLLERNYRNSKK